MSSITLNELTTITTAFLLTSSTVALTNVHPVYAQSPQEYLYSRCNQAYQQYLHYKSQPVASLDSSGTYVQTHSSTAQMQMTYLNQVSNCAINFSNLTFKDSSYCPYARRYTQDISPLMRTTAISVQANCS